MNSVVYIEINRDDIHVVAINTISKEGHIFHYKTVDEAVSYIPIICRLCNAKQMIIIQNGFGLAIYESLKTKDLKDIDIIPIKCTGMKFGLQQNVKRTKSLLEEVDNKINKYMHDTGIEDPYIFMNKNTADAIVCNINPHSHPTTICPKSIMGRYCGHKIFINDELKFGEVEIR